MSKYIINPDHTYPNFSYNHMGLSRQTLRFNSVSGVVEFDAAAQQASVEVEIDMRSIDTGSTVFDHHIQSEGMLDTDKHPTASYRSTGVAFEDGKPVRVDGDLTINGVTRPVSLQITHFFHGEHPMLKKDAVGANATASIKRSEFNAGAHVPFVGDEVQLNISLEAEVE